MFIPYKDEVFSSTIQLLINLSLSLAIKYAWHQKLDSHLDVYLIYDIWKKQWLQFVIGHNFDLYRVIA